MFVFLQTRRRNRLKSTRQVAKILLEYHASIDSLDKNERTPLHIAAMNGQDKLTEILLNNKANVNALDNRKRSPLDMAAEKQLGGRKDCSEVIKMLLQYGADPNINIAISRRIAKMAKTGANIGALAAVVQEYF